MSTNNNQYGKEVKPKWKNPAAESSKIMKLSGAKLQSLVSNDLSACTALTLSNRGIIKLEDLTGFGEILHRVDLSNNAITRLQGFSATPGISMLNVSSNELSGDASLEDLRYLIELRTLNIGNNPNIKYIRSHVAKPLQKLQALIAHECGFEKISFLKFIPNLNTLILSKNSISDFSVSEVGSFLHLTKLSIGRNMLKTLPDLSASVNLTELRINNNLLATIGDSILNNKKLKTLDISNNSLTSWDDVRKLVGLPLLTNLGVKGNNFPTPPESTDDLEVREDKAAETIDDITERRFRRFVLSMFLKTVGAANKSFEQLIVLDMKRVKMKLSPGMSVSADTEESSVSGPTAANTTSNSSSTKVSKKVSKARPAPSSDDEEAVGMKSKMKRTLGHSETNTATSPQKDVVKKRKKGAEQDSELEPASGILSQESEKQKKKKKSAVVDDSFLNSDEGKGTKERKGDKSAHIGSTPSSSSSSSSTSALGSGVVAVIVHKKTVKPSSLGKASKGKGTAESSSTSDALSASASAAGRDNLKGSVSASVSAVDDAAVSIVLGGSTCASNLIGIGGTSAW